MKDIVSLRNHLFDELNRLADCSTGDLESEVTRAASIVQVAETVIKTAQVENQFISITKGFGSGFIPVINDKKSLLDIEKERIDNNDDSKQEEYFDETKEKNWLVTEGSDQLGKHSD